MKINLPAREEKKTQARRLRENRIYPREKGEESQYPREKGEGE